MSSVTKIAATALLVSIAAVGCARHDGAGSGQPPASTPPSAVAAQATTPPTLGDPTAPAQLSIDQPTAGTSTGPATSIQPVAANAAAATPDPLDAQFSNLNDMLNGLNSSLSASDPATSGGE